MNVGEIKMFNKLLCDSWDECKERQELPWEQCATRSKVSQEGTNIDLIYE